MTASADPLLRLVRDEAQVNREHLARLLERLVALDPPRGTFGFLRGVRDGLSRRQLVLVSLLAQKALHLIDPTNPESLKPAELEKVAGVAGNTLRPVLRVLAERGITRRDEHGGHYVAGYGLEGAEQMLSEQGD